MIFISIILSLVAGGAITYLFLRPKLTQVEKFNSNIQSMNEELDILNNHLNQENAELDDLNQHLKQEKNNLDSEIINKRILINELDNSLHNLNKQAEQAAELFYKENMKLAEEKFDRSLEERSKEYQEAIQQLEKEFLNIQQENTEQFEKILWEKREELSHLMEVLIETHSEVAAAVEASKRAEEIKNQADFYRIQLSNQDIKEIQILRSIGPQLRNVEPLNKVIWKVYYEKPTSDLIGRVIGSGVHTGIYKITNIENQMCYVGQAADLASRWKQHIKRGLGADTPTKNKLYPAMMEFGPENFTFEVIEECDRAKLDQQEDYWQDFFLAKEFGYSIK